MKRLFILRAAPATGKSTWVEQNGLEDITVSSDEWRLALFGITEDENGNPCISQEKPWVVWGKVKEDIARRMEHDEDIILDACSLNTKDMNAYKALVEKNGYDVYVVEFFWDVNADICKERNANREDFRRVPEWVIDRFFEKVYDQPIPEYATAVTPDEAASMLYEG